MSAHPFSGLGAKVRALAACGAILAAAAPASALDPVTDPMEPVQGMTATAPRPAERALKRDFTRVPTLTERFGLPPVSGTLPPFLPPLFRSPMLGEPGSDALPPPTAPRPLRARQPRDGDG